MNNRNKVVIRLLLDSSKKGEKGIALVIALLMGVLLITAATGLLIRQLTARKISASESYQQMAENAANNGFNRILAVMNNADTDDYRGYLFTEDNEPGLLQWNNTFSKGEFCAGRIGLPQNLDADERDEDPWPTSSAGYILNEETLRDDGKGNLRSIYRLRSYAKDFASGKGTGTFEVEGIISRFDNDADTVDPILARARLTRSLQIESAIARPDDWGVIAAQTFNDEGSVLIDGPGRFLWFVGNANNSLCDNNFRNVQGETNQTVWPLMRDSDTPYIPNAEIYNRDGTIDTIQFNNRRYNRIWSFDDTHSIGAAGTPCNGSIVCTRPAEASNEQIPALSELSDSRVETSENDQTTGDAFDNIEFKTIRHNNKRNKFWIGTCKRDKNPVVDCKSEPGLSPNKNWNWQGDFKGKDKVPGSSITRWRYKDQTESIIQIGTCNRVNALDCNLSKNKHWRWNDAIQDNTPSEPQPPNQAAPNIIKIDSADICADKPLSDVCHLYIEHIKLNNTQVFIKNDTRAIVLHLNLGDGVDRSSWHQQNGHSYQLGENSKICGVNSLIKPLPDCNNEPAQLVITASGKTPAKSCPVTANSDDLLFAGDSLPAAWISMAKGRVRPDNASTRGVIWGSSICNEGTLTIKTEDDSEIAYVTKAKQYWAFSDYGGIGRRIVRGIRGSGFDIFKRW